MTTHRYEIVIITLNDCGAFHLVVVHHRAYQRVETDLAAITHDLYVTNCMRMHSCMYIHHVMCAVCTEHIHRENMCMCVCTLNRT